MLQTDRKTEAPRQTSQEKSPSELSRSHDVPAQAAQALEAILSGGSWEQLPAEGVLALSHSVGNGALLSILSLRSAPPETEESALPAGPCRTEACPWEAGAPLMAEAPDFGSFTSLGEAAPAIL